jgi:hypothetical protein
MKTNQTDWLYIMVFRVMDSRSRAIGAIFIAIA